MKVINAALLSFGMSGKLFHAPFIQAHSGFKLHAVWERSKNLAQEQYPHIITYRSLEEVLKDDMVNLVVVNTPNVTHYEYVMAALNAGKHVVVEKPFTVTVEEGEGLIKLAEEKGLLLSVYHNRRYDSDYKIVRKIVKENSLGSIVEAEFHFDRFREDLSPKQHKETAGPGTGALYDLGSHLIDQALQLFGMPEAVFADIRMVRPFSLVDDYFDLLLYYSDKRVRLKCSYLVREPLPAYILHGTKGSFIKVKSDVQEEALLAGHLPSEASWGTEPESNRGLLHTQKEGQIIREKIPSERGNYLEYYEGIYEALSGGMPLPVSAAEGLAVIRIIRAAFKSHETQCVVSL